MNGPDFALIEMVLGFGVVLAWAFWELWSLRRDKRRAADTVSAETRPEGSRHPEGQHGAHGGGSETP